MKVLIAYRSKYGTTADCVRSLAERLRAPPVVIDLARGRAPDVRPFDVVLVGGSIYGGTIQREVVSFCERRQDLLLERSFGLFLCCLYQGERAQAQLRAAFPEALVAHAFAHGLFGGELRYGTLTLLDRLLVRGLPHPKGDVSLLLPVAIQEMADAVNARL